MQAPVRALVLFLVVALTSAAATTSCSGASEGNEPGGGAGGTAASGGTGAAGTGGVSASGGSDASTGGGSGGLLIDGSPPDGKVDKDASCGDITEEATKIPLAMYIMLDQSCSMDDGVKWPAAVDGITQFVQSKGSAGVKVALQMFPTIADNGQCSGSGYDTPAVPMVALPGNASAIIGALPSSANGGDTPTEGALHGLINYSKTYSSQNPKEKVIGLFITDGEPTSCDQSPSTLAGIVNNGFTQAPSVLTFVMGMSGADFSLLNQLAQAAGTGVAFDLSSGGAQALLGVLQSIASAAIGCDYTIPESDGGKIDYSKVVVHYSSGGTDTNIPQVSDQSACGTSDGFYYDNPITPTKISLCPTTCDAVQGDDQAKIQVLLGCAIIAPT